MDNPQFTKKFLSKQRKVEHDLVFKMGFDNFIKKRYSKTPGERTSKQGTKLTFRSKIQKTRLGLKTLGDQVEAPK